MSQSSCEETSCSGTPYYKKRYWVFALITLVAMGLPFIQIDGNQLFLLSFDKKQLHLLGVAFDMQELYLMPFLLMLLFLGIFFVTTLAGRVWCGWGCPQTIFRVIYRDVIETKLLGLRKRIDNKQQEPDMSLPINKLKKGAALLIWIGISVIAASNFLWYFIPPADFFTYLSNPAEHTILITFLAVLVAVMVFDIIFIKENFCVYMCPYSRVQSVLYDNDTIMTVYDYERGGKVFDPKGIKLWKKPETPNAECTGCELCVKVCPTHIDIRKGMQLECINCLECADACTKVMGKLGKESLIGWTSPQAVETREKVRYFRFRTIAYMVALVIVMGALVVMSGKKEHMLLNINRTTELYSIKEQGMVENSYVFLFQNTDKVAHDYYFEILDNPKIKIKRPEEPFALEPGKKVKKVVVLYTEERLSEDGRKDTPVPIKIHAYALDKKEEISVFRDSVFVYPRIDLIH